MGFIGTGLVRLLKVCLGGWIIFGPFLPYALLMESHPIMGGILSAFLAVVVITYIVWKYTHGSVKTIHSILKDTLIVFAVSALAGGVIGFLNGISHNSLRLESWEYLLIAWGWLCFLELKKNKPPKPVGEALPKDNEMAQPTESPNKLTVGEADPLVSQTKQCPFCGETIMQTAIKCRYCGEWLEKGRDQKIGFLERLGRLAGGNNWRDRFSALPNAPEPILVAGYLLILNALASVFLWLLTLTSPNFRTFLALDSSSAITIGMIVAPLTLGFFLLKGKNWARILYLWIGVVGLVALFYKIRNDGGVFDDWLRIGFILALFSLLLGRGSLRKAKILGLTYSLVLLLLLGLNLYIVVFGMPLEKERPLPDVSYTNSEYGIEIPEFPPGWSVIAKNKDFGGTFNLLELRKAYGDLVIYLYAEKEFVQPNLHAAAVRSIFSNSFKIPSSAAITKVTYGKLQGETFVEGGTSGNGAITIGTLVFRHEIDQFRLVCYGNTKNQRLVSEELAAFAEKIAFLDERRPQIERLVQYYKPIVVTIVASNKIQGTGFFVTNDGTILTNAHVVGQPGHLRVFMNDGREFAAERIYQNPNLDVALIRVPVSVNWLPMWGRMADIKEGEEVTVIGSPQGLASSVTKGIVSSVWKEGGRTFIQTDASISPGASGSPLIDRRGRLIGIIFSKITKVGSEGLGFALSIDDLRFLFG